MAISTKNQLLHQVSGAIGKLLVIKNYGYQTVISKKPDMSKVIKTEKQAIQRDKFQNAQAYAKTVISDPVLNEEYLDKLLPNQKVYHAAISDYMKRH